VRAFVLSGPGQGAVLDVPPPHPGVGEVVVAVERVGLCGTDVEFFTGEMPYLSQGHAAYPIRLGHEWAGRVVDVGAGVDPAWVARRVTGDTMLGDGTCRSCRRGRPYVCEQREEVGIRGGRDGALAERLAVPATSLRMLPDTVDAALGALVEPGGSAWRSAEATGSGPGDRVLVIGPGTIGLLVAMFVRARGAEVHVLGETAPSLDFARSLGFENVWRDAPGLPFDAVVNASTGADVPTQAVDLVEASGRVVYVGLAGRPSSLDTRRLTFKDVTAVGILSGSPGLDQTISAYASGEIDPRPLVAAVVGLDEVGDVLAGQRPADAGSGPKVQVDPRALSAP
jgi:threonine dehydrogenase-like Zn-dependent dehydrogenase